MTEQVAHVREMKKAFKVSVRKILTEETTLEICIDKRIKYISGVPHMRGAWTGVQWWV
jgi:hypothetical protein